MLTFSVNCVYDDDNHHQHIIEGISLVNIKLTMWYDAVWLYGFAMYLYECMNMLCTYHVVTIQIKYIAYICLVT